MSEQISSLLCTEMRRRRKETEVASRIKGGNEKEGSNASEKMGESEPEEEEGGDYDDDDDWAWGDGVGVGRGCLL